MRPLWIVLFIDGALFYSKGTCILLLSNLLSNYNENIKRDMEL